MVACKRLSTALTRKPAQWKTDDSMQLNPAAVESMLFRNPADLERSGIDSRVVGNR